jgi:uncharacterized protein YndB with AHSA1/START domain
VRIRRAVQVARNEITIAAPPERVFAVLSDPAAYVEWVVGTSMTEAVGDGWPEVGAKLHYRAGRGPLTVSDTTEVIECVPGRRLVLRARMRPLGETAIEIDLLPTRTEQATVVRLVEQPATGAVAALENPITDRGLALRNVFSLRRLKGLVERQPAP